MLGSLAHRLQQHRFYAVLALAAGGLNLALLALYYAGGEKLLVGDEAYYYALASAAYQGEFFRDNLLWPPLYGDFVAGIMGLGGRNRIGTQIVQIVLWYLTAVLFASITKKITGSEFQARYTYFFALFSLELIAYSHYFWPETLHLFLWGLTLWLIVDKSGDVLLGLIAGVPAGLAMVTKSLLLPFLPICCALALIGNKSRASLRNRFFSSTLFLLAIFLVAVGFAWPEFAKYGISSIGYSGPFNLWVGLNDSSLLDYGDQFVSTEYLNFEQLGDDFIGRNEIYTRKIIDKVKQEGPGQLLTNQLSKQYFRLFNVQTFFTTQLPGGARAAYQFDTPVLASGLSAVASIQYAFILATGVMGLGLVSRHTKPAGWLFLAFVVYNLALFLFLHAKTRYVIQFFPILIFFSGNFITCFKGFWAEPDLRRVINDRTTVVKLVLLAAAGLLTLFISLHSLIP